MNQSVPPPQSENQSQVRVLKEQGFWFGHNRLLQGVFIVYVTLWLSMAISPVDRIDWLLENLLVFAFFGLLISVHRDIELSDRSYYLIFLFLGLHAIGAHYTYGQVPFGYWLRDQFGFNRNHFDRIAHFAYGLLFAYPFHEICVKKLRVKGFWSYYFPVDIILACSAFFELLEAWIAQSITPDLAQKYLGSQGDVYDAANDMAAAFTGSILTMAFTAWRFRGALAQRPS